MASVEPALVPRRRFRRAAALTTALAIVGPGDASAGPPYETDDPEPVEYRHWELYLASQTARERDGWSGTAPHVEVNYGVIPDVQLHVIVPIAYRTPLGERAAFGLGDMELGVKLRFLGERAWSPMIGTFPMVELPTGSSRRGLGNGTAQVFLPVWLQKSFGPWSTYGGLGVLLDAGDANRHGWFFGWQGQRRIGEAFTVGAEVFHRTPEEPGGEGDTRFNVGATVDLGETHHLIASAGRSIAATSSFQGYFAYLLTLGP
jgi:hypothetical protein